MEALFVDTVYYLCVSESLRENFFPNNHCSHTVTSVGSKYWISDLITSAVFDTGCISSTRLPIRRELLRSG